MVVHMTPSHKASASRGATPLGAWLHGCALLDCALTWFAWILGVCCCGDRKPRTEVTAWKTAAVSAAGTSRSALAPPAPLTLACGAYAFVTWSPGGVNGTNGASGDSDSSDEDLRFTPVTGGDPSPASSPDTEALVRRLSFSEALRSAKHRQRESSRRSTKGRMKKAEQGGSGPSRVRHGCV